MLTAERLAEVLAYCKLTELADDPEVAELIPRFAADAEAYLAGAGIAPPEPEASSRSMYDQVVNYMVLDAWDHRDAWTPGSYTENPAFRRQLNQLKLTGGGGWF